MKDQNFLNTPDFLEVLEYCKDEKLYLGEGNPNAKILLIGKEAGFNRAEGPLLANAENKKEWLLKFSQETALNNLDRLENDYHLNGLPQLKKDIGSNPTWRSYQRLVNLINGIEKKDIPKGGKGDWDFLDNSFISEINQIRLPKSNYLEENDISDSIRKESVEKRAKLFQQSFFRKFPIVIIATGPDYLDNSKNGKYKYDFNIEREFNVKFKELITIQEKGSKTRWYNVHREIEGERRIVIHTRQLSTVGEHYTSLYPLLNKIAEECTPYL